MESLITEDDEDWLRTAPSSLNEAAADVAAKKRQKKVLTLDDILQIDHKETIRKSKPKAKSNKLLQKLKLKSYLYSSSDDEDAEDLRAPQLLDELEKQVTTGVAEEVELEWGQPVFGPRSEFPSLTRGGAPNLQRALQASKEAGREASLEELVSSGFLRAWALCTKRCDESTLRWAYHQMAYAIEESVERAACKFLCDLVSRIAMDSGAPSEMDWLPTLVDIKQTLVVYGYKEHSKDKDSSSESIERMPPKNLRSILEFIAMCFVTRNVQPYYSVADVANLLVIMVHLTLERNLLAILDKVQECILALLRYFGDEEWEEMCPHVAAVISGLTERSHNVVFVLGVLSGLGKRSVDLQRSLALHELTKLSRRKKLLATPREVATLFESVNLKAKAVEFQKLYYQVVIADTFLWCNEGLSDEMARRAWLKFLGLCSRQIYIGDERAFATTLRNTASFLVQKYEHEWHGSEVSPVKAVEEDDE